MVNKIESNSPWNGLYDAMYAQVPRNDAERMATKMIRNGTGLIESMEQSGLTHEEFQDLFDRLTAWENDNFNKPENW